VTVLPLFYFRALKTGTLELSSAQSEKARFVRTAVNSTMKVGCKRAPISKKPVRKGVWRYYGCCEQFTVTVGAVFEDSHIPLNRWLLAAYLLCASKKGMSLKE
jgi:hypothetical protein